MRTEPSAPARAILDMTLTDAERDRPIAWTSGAPATPRWRRGRWRPSPEAFVALLAGLHTVSAETWLRALPESAVAALGC